MRSFPWVFLLAIASTTHAAGPDPAPLCQLTLDGKFFGKLYQGADKALHLSYALTVSAGGKDALQHPDLIVSGASAPQGVTLPEGAHKCKPVAGTWKCSAFGDGFDCNQDDMSGLNGPPQLSFKKTGTSEGCDQMAKELEQRRTLMSVAACLRDAPQAPPDAPQAAPAAPQDAPKDCAQGSMAAQAYLKRCMAGGREYASCCTDLKTGTGGAPPIPGAANPSK
jgi:hypothetical protein